MNVRPPAVAGQFYPASAAGIKNEIETHLQAESSLIDQTLAGKRIIGGISPHAGYIFCLPQAVHLFRLLQLSRHSWDPVVVLNPNHTGRGRPLSIDLHNRWSTPLGEVPVDGEAADFLIRESAAGEHPLYREPQAHKGEHSGEVILPLLQYFLKDFSLLPLCMGDSSYGAAVSLAELFVKFKEEYRSDPLIIASSDFTHFESPERGRALDDYALEALLNLDTRDFFLRVGEKHISICGYGPIIVLLEYAKRVSSNPGVSLLRRGHSGESPYFRGREQAEVVDYVSLLVYEE
ncbi:MAG: AmmeMemoRadiSam system protein B [Spirochaetales bacterium]|nr:AmmeMemoRadiSam system protein B [Spirochaetales bacterium]